MNPTPYMRAPGLMDGQIVANGQLLGWDRYGNEVRATRHGRWNPAPPDPTLEAGDALIYTATFRWPPKPGDAMTTQAQLNMMREQRDDARLAHREAVRRINDLQTELARRNRTLNEVGEALERAVCNGEGYDPDYGWPTGDHVPQTMADEIINTRKRLEAEIASLREFDEMISAPVDEEELAGLRESVTTLRRHARIGAWVEGCTESTTFVVTPDGDHDIATALVFRREALEAAKEPT